MLVIFCILVVKIKLSQNYHHAQLLYKDTKVERNDKIFFWHYRDQVSS